MVWWPLKIMLQPLSEVYFLRLDLSQRSLKNTVVIVVTVYMSIAVRNNMHFVLYRYCCEGRYKYSLEMSGKVREFNNDWPPWIRSGLGLGLRSSRQMATQYVGTRPAYFSSSNQFNWAKPQIQSNVWKLATLTKLKVSDIANRFGGCYSVASGLG